MNRRLIKLAKWADSSSEERHAEFRNNPNHNYPYRTLIKPMIYSKPISAVTVPVMRSVVPPATYTPGFKNMSIAAPELKAVAPEQVAVPVQVPVQAPVPAVSQPVAIEPKVEVVAPASEADVKEQE